MFLKVGAVAALFLIVIALGAFAITGRSDPFTPQPTPCPIEALEKAAEDAFKAYQTAIPQPGDHLRTPEFRAYIEANQRAGAAKNGERVMC
ncbi:MAG: hypothetical protein F4W93_04690 [Dehalococcoidia bacterium]|nr:hypothetical protein [Dehalococcoidia bacterium]